MSHNFDRFETLSDSDLIARVTQLSQNERRATARVVAALAELERRKLYLPQGYASMFSYCTRALHFSEHAAYNRIEAARAAARFPTILEGLHEGTLTLTAIRILAPVLTPENHARLLSAARHASKRDIEVLAATERPQPDAPALVRRAARRGLPAAVRNVAGQRQALGSLTGEVAHYERTKDLRVLVGSAPSPNPRTTLTPLSPERYLIRFTASREFHDKLRRVQALMRHTIPSGDPAEILNRALDLLLTDVEKRKSALTDRPRAPAAGAPKARHIPAAVKRDVWKRDEGRCVFAGRAGRCGETAFLEYHHVIPFAQGGAATTSNIELRCRAHNAYEAERCSGRLFTRQEPIP